MKKHHLQGKELPGAQNGGLRAQKNQSRTKKTTLPQRSLLGGGIRDPAYIVKQGANQHWRGGHAGSSHCSVKKHRGIQREKSGEKKKRVVGTRREQMERASADPVTTIQNLEVAHGKQQKSNRENLRTEGAG